ncbi:hypothetical protein PU02_1094 [Bartonella ancashensis]|uniref:Uncharacterized protein n=1 Tax=Bartonella ancashensis TaxID=1318743 RepID=A0A0M4L7I7_9HYPH|nr:hypothetical protein PU02_1094 [Bartonella ancashensis]
MCGVLCFFCFLLQFDFVKGEHQSNKRNKGMLTEYMLDFRGGECVFICF